MLYLVIVGLVDLAIKTIEEDAQAAADHRLRPLQRQRQREQQA